MNTSFPLERLLMLVIGSVVPLSSAIVVALAAPGSAFAIGMTTVVAAPIVTDASIPNGTINDYQPPNNGGPGKTGGSGTR